MAKRLFVGGLPYTITDKELTDLFSKAGVVESAKVIIDRYSGRSKGFGFVEMTTDEEAQNAIKTLNETEIEGRKIVVNEARPLEPRENSGGGGFQRDFNSGGGRRDDRRGGPRQKRW
jgi:RNA recognition motif-containing protein